MRQAGQRIGIDGVSPYWLRHTHASHSWDRGASLSVVKETLGHANIALNKLGSWPASYPTWIIPGMMG